MKKYLLPENGTFYKANLHCHSVCSDGMFTPEELKTVYKGMGYSVLAITDHDILVAHDYLNDEEFITLHGFKDKCSFVANNITIGRNIKRTYYCSFVADKSCAIDRN